MVLDFIIRIFVDILFGVLGRLEGDERLILGDLLFGFVRDSNIRLV